MKFPRKFLWDIDKIYELLIVLFIGAFGSAKNMSDALTAYFHSFLKLSSMILRDERG